MGYLKFALAAAYAAGVLMFPDAALTAARDAMEMWYWSVAPALFPFAAMMPYLTSGEARYIYDKILGWFVKRAFRLPGGCASAFVTGLFAGSPGGAMAAARVAAAEKLSPVQTARLALICCGMSPVYLVSGLGAAVMGDAGAGWRLVIAQWIANIVVGILSARLVRDGGDENLHIYNSDSTVGAVTSVLRVCGYMALFSVGISVASRIAGRELVYTGLLLDVPGRAAAAVKAGINGVFLAAAAGFGGVCITVQNMSILKQAGVTWKMYLSGKACVSCVCAAVYCAMPRIVKFAVYIPGGRIYEGALLVIFCMIVPVTAVFFLRKRCGSTIS